MICAKCGARLLDTDQFCPECGAKVIREKRCPDCGAVLREGTKFCHKCGRLVENMQSSCRKKEETIDIPIDAIERTIVAETEAKVMAECEEEELLHRKPATKTAERRTEAGQTVKRSSAGPHEGRTTKARHSQDGAAKRSPEPPVKKRAATDTPPKKRKPVYREEDDWEDEEDDEESVDVITIMTAVVGCVLLVVVAFLAYNLYRQYVPKDYEKTQEQQLEEQQVEQEGQEGQEEQTADEGENAVGTLIIVDNVNVRDNPSTQGTNVLKVAKAGETYECYGSVEDGEWYEIRLEDGTTGYVFKDYVKIEE